MRKLTVEFYPSRHRPKPGRPTRWSWRLKGGNGVNWASPTNGFSQKSNALRSFWAMVDRMGADRSRFKVEFLDHPPKR